MSYYDEYFCPNCNAILNDQPGFDPNLGVWTCTECGQTLYGDDVQETMSEFDGVVWYCDSCGSILNKQFGFSDDCGVWICTECGHLNPIDEDEVYDSEDDCCGKITWLCPHCGAKLNKQWMFDNNEEWTCTECDTNLYYDDGEYHVASNDSWDDDDDEDDDDDDSDDMNEHSCCGSGYRLGEYTDDRYIGKKTNNSKKANKIIRRICILAIIVGLVYFEITKLTPTGFSDDSFIGVTYDSAEKYIKEAGFPYVIGNEVEDLSIEEIDSENIVTNVKIGWIRSFSEQAKLPSNFPVIVTYHTLAKISVPMSSKSAKGENYSDVIKAFKKAGFVDVTVKVEYDILTGWFTKDGEVKSVSVGGSKKFSDEEMFRPDAPVIITYHTFFKNAPK